MSKWWIDEYSSDEEYAKSEIGVQLDHCLSEVRDRLENTDLEKQQIEEIIKEALESFAHNCNCE